MFGLRAAAARSVGCAHIADPEAAAAYRSLEAMICIGCDPRLPLDLRRLTYAVLGSYAEALNASESGRRSAWATFVRRATLLHFAFDNRPERHFDPRWKRAALTLRQIALENADLIGPRPRAAAP